MRVRVRVRVRLPEDPALLFIALEVVCRRRGATLSVAAVPSVVSSRLVLMHASFSHFPQTHIHSTQHTAHHPSTTRYTLIC